MFLSKKQLSLTKIIDIGLLNALYPGFGNHYLDDFIRGLELYVIGLLTSNRTQYRKGQAMIFKWINWLDQHEDDIRQIIDEEL